MRQYGGGYSAGLVRALHEAGEGRHLVVLSPGLYAAGALAGLAGRTVYVCRKWNRSPAELARLRGAAGGDFSVLEAGGPERPDIGDADAVIFEDASILAFPEWASAVEMSGASRITGVVPCRYGMDLSALYDDIVFDMGIVPAVTGGHVPKIRLFVRPAADAAPERDMQEWVLYGRHMLIFCGDAEERGRFVDMIRKAFPGTCVLEYGPDLGKDAAMSALRMYSESVRGCLLLSDSFQDDMRLHVTDTVINLSPARDVLQYAGRVAPCMDPLPGKTEAALFDYVGDASPVTALSLAGVRYGLLPEWIRELAAHGAIFTDILHAARMDLCPGCPSMDVHRMLETGMRNAACEKAEQIIRDGPGSCTPFGPFRAVPSFDMREAYNVPLQYGSVSISEPDVLGVRDVTVRISDRMYAVRQADMEGVLNIVRRCCLVRGGSAGIWDMDAFLARCAQPATGKQRAKLMRLNIPDRAVPDGLSMAQASDLIRLNDVFQAERKKCTRKGIFLPEAPCSGRHAVEAYEAYMQEARDARAAAYRDFQGFCDNSLALAPAPSWDTGEIKICRSLHGTAGGYAYGMRATAKQVSCFHELKEELAGLGYRFDGEADALRDTACAHIAIRMLIELKKRAPRLGPGEEALIDTESFRRSMLRSSVRDIDMEIILKKP